MSRRGDHIRKRKDGRWEGRYRDGINTNGSIRYRSVYAPTYTACKEKLATAMLAPSPPQKIQTHTFAQAAETWFCAKQTELKGSTKLKYRNLFNRHLLPELGPLSVSDMNAATVGMFLENKRRSGSLVNKQALSPSYVKTMSILITAVLEFAASLGWCSPFERRIKLHSAVKNEPVVLNRSVEQKLTEFLFCEHTATATGTLLALQAGLRIGEVCALRWCDIDFGKGILTVRHTLSRVLNDTNGKSQVKLSEPKTRSSHRCIPLPTMLLQRLFSERSTNAFCYVVSNSTTFTDTRTFEYRYKALLRKIGMQPVNFHALRHTYATRLSEAGMDAKTLSILLGHASTVTTLNLYVHPSMDAAKQQLQQIYSVG